MTVGLRRSRGNTEQLNVGAFARRASERPNRIAVTMCELTAVDGRSVHVRGLDTIEGTPVLDIKPVMTNFIPRGDIRPPAWVDELMVRYWNDPSMATED